MTDHERTQALASAYDQWHAQADRQNNEWQERYYRWLANLLKPSSGSTLLDVACGRGDFLDFMSRCGFRPYGVDISSVAIDIARERLPNARLEVANGEDLPFDDATFDFVTCLGSLEHFEDPARGAREIARVLRSDGKALVLLPNLFFLGHVYLGLRHGTQPSEGGQGFSEQFRSTQGWQQLLEEAGLRVVDWKAWNYVFASDKVSPWAMRLWNLIAPLVPKHGGMHLTYICARDK